MNVFEFNLPKQLTGFEVVALATLHAVEHGDKVVFHTTSRNETGEIDSFETDGGGRFQIFRGSYGYMKITCEFKIEKHSDAWFAFTEIFERITVV